MGDSLILCKHSENKVIPLMQLKDNHWAPIIG